MNKPAEEPKPHPKITQIKTLLNSFHDILVTEVRPLLKHYETDIQNDFRSLTFYLLEREKAPKNVILYVRDAGTDIFFPDMVGMYDTGDYRMSPSAGGGKDITVFVIELKTVEEEVRNIYGIPTKHAVERYVVKKKLPLVEYWPNRIKGKKGDKATREYSHFYD